MYEADGTDNGFSEPWHVNINAFASDSVYGGVTENLVVEDVDGDGLDEVIFAFNGGSNPTAGYSTYSEDRFFVVGVQGDIGVLPKAVEEFVIAPRDRNKDGVRGNDHGGGSAMSMAVADTDGDGKHEIAFFSWNGGNMFVADATGPDTYVAPDSGEYVRFGSSSFPGNTAGADDFSFNPTAIDMDGDGKDEIYATGYYTQNIYVYADKDGDATKIGADEVSIVVLLLFELSNSVSKSFPRMWTESTCPKTGLNYSLSKHGVSYFNKTSNICTLDIIYKFIFSSIGKAGFMNIFHDRL